TEKQTLIDKFRKSEHLYKQAQSLAHVGNWSWDMRSNHIEWSDELYRIYGMELKAGNFSYEEYLSHIHPNDLKKVKDQVQHSIEKKEPWEYTHKLITKDGVVKTVHATGEILLDEKGEVYMLIGTAQDISEREVLIEKLQQSDAFYRQAQALSRMGNFVWDIKTNEVVWSDEVYHIYNIPKDHPVTFQTAFDPILPLHKKNVQDSIEKTIHLKKGHGVSYAIKHHDGSIKYINLETDVILDENGIVQKIMGTAQDVTERQVLIEKLQESESLFKQAQSIAHLGNWTMDVKTMNFSWSDEMYKIFEIDKNEVFNFYTWAAHLHPDEKQTVIDYYYECLSEKKHYDKIHRIILRNGKMKTIHRKAEFIFDENGEPIIMVGTTQDITDEYRIQQELKDNQTFIRKITDATPSIIASYNVNSGKYVFISEGLEKLLGYDRQLVLEKGVSFFADVIHPEDMMPFMEKNSKTLQDSNQSKDYDPVVEFTYRMRHTNGEYRWFHTYGTIFDRNKDNKVEHVLNISLDVTEQVEATQKIKEQEHFIQQIADASPTILYLYDVDKQS
ncbi:MAG: PAS domain-containing protein, partial [Flavisolibacter sp.]